MLSLRSVRGVVSGLAPLRAQCATSIQVRSYATKGKAEKADAHKAPNGQVRVDFKENTFEVYKSDAPENFTHTNKEELISMYTMMTRIRRMEITADNLYKQKLIRGFCHLYNGQEAIAAGVEAAITKKDAIITAYRDHGLMVARGSEPRSVLAELMMKARGCSKGKGGSMHMFDVPNNFWGGHGIVGAQTPLGAGIAFTQKYLKTGHVAFTFYGDGAANQGQLFEAYNMAMLWKLPCIFVCENNQYAMGTSIARGSADTQYFTRGHYIPGIKVDAMNALAVKKATQHVLEHVRADKGPFVMEMNTYRYVGHSMSDPGTTYRTRDEINAIRAERDPIEKIKKYILEFNFATEEELKGIEVAARKEMDEAVAWAQEGGEPDMKELFTDIYREPMAARHVELVNSYNPAGAK